MQQLGSSCFDETGVIGMESQGIRQAGAQIVETVKAICRMCHGGCGTIVTVKDGIVDKVVGDPDNPINDGLLCSKGGRPSIEQLYHPDRIDYPMIRVGEKGAMAWRQVSGTRRCDYIAEKMLAIRARARRGGGRLRARHRRSTTITSPAGWPICSAARTSSRVGYFCYGPRVAVCKVTAAGKSQRQAVGHGRDLRFLQQPGLHRGMGLAEAHQQRPRTDRPHADDRARSSASPVSIIVDPRKPAAAGKGDIWLPLRPGTDAAMALGWMNVIIEEELYDKEFVENWCHGFEELQAAGEGVSARRRSPTSPGAMPRTSRAPRGSMHAPSRRRIAWGNGTDQLGVNTFQATRALFILMGITGNLDVPGGNCF